MDSRIKFLIILLIGVAMFVFGRITTVDYLQDFFILTGTIVFFVGLVGGIGSLRKKKTTK